MFSFGDPTNGIAFWGFNKGYPLSGIPKMEPSFGDSTKVVSFFWDPTKGIPLSGFDKGKSLLGT